eukprot:scaffold30977_cov90-Phaeocystis_antarctica.AAC.1
MVRTPAPRDHSPHSFDTACPERPKPAPLSPAARPGGKHCMARGSDCACESDGGDSDGQGTPQGGGGVQSTPLRRAQRKSFRCLGVKRPVS